LSHHTSSVLELLLAGVRVPVPADLESLWPERADRGSSPALDDACGDAHQAVPAAADVDGYAASGLPARTMGRDLEEDRLFFAAALASGAALASVA
jgi:hypothetical protein